MTKSELENLTKIGKFTNQLKKNVRNLITEKNKASDIINYIEMSIFKNGYLPAFPCIVCINDVAAHYTIFDDDIEIKKGDLVKVDFGVSKNGLITDTAFTIEVSTNKYKEMLKCNLDVLNEQLELVNNNTKMYELGKIVEDKAKSIGYNTIHNLTGHQIEKNNLHAGLMIPNYNNGDTNKVLNKMVLAIEPYFSTGSSRIKNGMKGNILHLINPKPVRDNIARKVLNYIKDFYPHLPFSKRWLLKDVAQELGVQGGFSKNQVLYAVNILKKNRIIYEHDTLVSSDGSVNSQFEETVVIMNNKKVVVTRL
jgi:methionyl aminopeptidase